MSKSLGNFFTVHDLLTGNNPEQVKYPGEVIRFVFLSTHYRKPMDWTAEKAREAEKTLRKWYAKAAQGVGTGQPYIAVVQALADDLNTPLAISELHQLYLADDVLTLRYTLQFLGLLAVDVPEWFSGPTFDLSMLGNMLSEERSILAVLMKNKDFSEVDRLKSSPDRRWVEVRMSKDGVDLIPGPDFDPAKLEALK